MSLMVIFKSNQSDEKTAIGDSMVTESTLKVLGMTCDGCSSRIEKVLSKMEGIQEVKASWENDTVYVKFEESKVSVNVIEEKLKGIGFTTEGIL